MTDLLIGLRLMLGRFSSVVLLGLVIGLYLLPTLIGIKRRKRNLPNIAFFNILLGWTGIAWAAMLVESFKRDDAP